MARVLVVDDAADLRLLIGLALEADGHAVVEADGGPRALALLEGDDGAGGEAVDLVVLDIQMPEMDGWTVLERIRASARTAEMPVVVCTVKAGGADRERAWAAGCDDFLSKPFDLGELRAVVDGALGVEPRARRARRRAQLEALRAQQPT